MKKSRVRNGAGFLVRDLQLRFFVAANLRFFTASFLRFFVAYFIVFACERPIFSASALRKWFTSWTPRCLRVPFLTVVQYGVLHRRR